MKVKNSKNNSKNIFAANYLYLRTLKNTFEKTSFFLLAYLQDIHLGRMFVMSKRGREGSTKVVHPCNVLIFS